MGGVGARAAGTRRAQERHLTGVRLAQAPAALPLGSVAGHGPLAGAHGVHGQIAGVVRVRDDLVEGQAGNDTMEFIGSAGSEAFEASAVAGRLRFIRDLGNIVMDVNDVERVDVNALAGVDRLTVNDLTGTDVTQINANLAGTIGGTTGDTGADTVIVTGTNANNAVDVVGAGTSIAVIGLPVAVNLTGVEAADALTVQGLGGNDAITAATLTTAQTVAMCDDLFAAHRDLLPPAFRS